MGSFFSGAISTLSEVKRIVTLLITTSDLHGLQAKVEFTKKKRDP